MQFDSPLIPRRVLFSDPDHVNPRISPDGKFVSFIASFGGTRNIYVAPVDDLRSARAVTRVTDSGLWDYVWNWTGTDITYPLDDKGDEHWNFYRVNIASGDLKNLTPNPKIRAFLSAASPQRPEEIVVRMNDRDVAFHDLHRINIHTGRDELVLENPGRIEDGNVTDFIIDAVHTVRFVQTVTDDGGSALFIPDGNGGWRRAETILMQDVTSYSIEGFDESGEHFYTRDGRDRDTTAVYEVDARNGAKTLLAENDKVDVGDVLRHPWTGVVQAVSFNYARKQWQAVDPGLSADLAYLAALVDGEMSIVSRSRDDRMWIVSYNRPDGPAAHYLYRRDARKPELLFHDVEELARCKLAKVRPVVIKSRDGLDLVSYVTLPNAAEPKRPIPTVLYVHGGPYGRDQYRFHDIHQWLANRGYAVLAVNFRGSTGFGKRFLNAGNREWGGKMHDDLIDAVRWAIDERIADPNRIAIMGGSYGGYATLVGMTFTPDVFACGVAMSAISSLTSFLDNIPPHWKSNLPFYVTRLGDPTTPEGRAFLDSRSPLKFVDRISKPLLIGHGANDPRCRKPEADQIVAAMRERKIPVTYALFPDEGHGWTRLENRLSFFAVAEEFLAKYLGGRCEPVGDDFARSSIQLVEDGFR